MRPETSARVKTCPLQVYYRYYHGITRDDRFGAFKETVQLLMAGAADIIEKQ